MFNPSQLTLGEIASTFRDLAIVAVIVKLAWSSRGVYEHGKAFFMRCIAHMDSMEIGMKTLLENHLTHIEADLAKLTGREIKK